MLDTKGVKYKFPIRMEDLDKRLSHLEEAFKGLVQRLYRLGIIKKGEEKGDPFDPSQYDWKPTPEDLKNLERIILEGDNQGGK